MLLWPRDKQLLNPSTTTSQEGGAVSEARPPGRVSEAVFYFKMNTPQLAAAGMVRKPT